MDGAFHPRWIRTIRQSPTLTVGEAEGPAGQPMVVKRLDLEKADPVEKRRFAREMHLASILAHPSLPVMVAQGSDWIGLERLEGSLADLAADDLRRQPGSVRAMLAALADALAYIHARGVVHGDIKPAHVMFRGERPVLIDFGIASIGRDEPDFGSELVGTPAWMAPEQVVSPHCAPPADIWSLSAVMTSVLTRTRPYDGEADDVLARRRAGERPKFRLGEDLRGVDPELCDSLEQGLALQQEKRPTAAAIARRLAVS